MLSIPVQTHIFRFDIYTEEFWGELEDPEIFPERSFSLSPIVSIDNQNIIYWNGSTITLDEIQKLVNPENLVSTPGVSLATSLSLRLPDGYNTIRFRASDRASYLMVHKTLATLRKAHSGFVKFENIDRFDTFGKASVLPKVERNVGEKFIPCVDRKSLFY